MKTRLMVLVGCLVAAALIPSGAGAAPQRGTTKSFIVGASQGTPAAIPTKIDPVTGKFHVVGIQTFHGSLNGVSHYDLEGVIDVKTFEYHASGTNVFVGMYMRDHSVGTLTWTEHWSGNFLEQTGFAVARFVTGDGDPSFQCTSGKFTQDFAFVGAVASSVGGYNGTWIHTCPKR